MSEDEGVLADRAQHPAGMGEPLVALEVPDHRGAAGSGDHDARRSRRAAGARCPASAEGPRGHRRPPGGDVDEDDDRRDQPEQVVRPGDRADQDTGEAGERQPDELVALDERAPGPPQAEDSSRAQDHPQQVGGHRVGDPGEQAQERLVGSCSVCPTREVSQGRRPELDRRLAVRQEAPRRGGERRHPDGGGTPPPGRARSRRGRWPVSA